MAFMVGLMPLSAFSKDLGFHIRICDGNNEIDHRQKQYNLEKQRDKFGDGTVPRVIVGFAQDSRSYHAENSRTANSTVSSTTKHSTSSTSSTSTHYNQSTKTIYILHYIFL
jgi:hypothetical protein